MIKYKITVILVTYSNRKEYVKIVIKAAFNEGVSDIVLVDNASDSVSQKYYDELAKNNSRIHLIRNKKNLGSAGGFKVGISFLLFNLSPDYIWFLDDDNVPQSGSLESLIKAKEYLLSGNTDKKDFVLYSYRGDKRIFDKKAVSNGYIKVYNENNFMGFRIQDFLKDKIYNNQDQDYVLYPIVRVFHGPYGGAFFSFNVLNEIGYPDESFFLYADDHEFTNRVNLLNVDQYLIYNSRLLDIDESFDEDGLFSFNTNEMKVYYTFRNHVYLNQNHKTKYWKYNLNKYIYIIFLIFKAVKFSIYNYKKAIKIFDSIKLGIKDGESKANAYKHK